MHCTSFLLAIKKELDIIFLLDLSSDVTTHQLSAMKDYVKNMLKSFTLSAEDVRVGLIGFGETAQEFVELNLGTNQDVISNGISKISKIGGTRNLDIGMMHIVNEASKSFRLNSKKVIVTLTTGTEHPKRHKELTEAVKKLKEKHKPNFIFVEFGDSKLRFPEVVDETTVNVNTVDELPSTFSKVIKEIGSSAGTYSLQIFVKKVKIFDNILTIILFVF